MERTRSSNDIVQESQRLADEVLFPAALTTDASTVVPRSLLDSLASAGLYGLAGPLDAGGLAVDAETAGRVVEALAGGCLTTTFVWAQHHGAVRTIARAGKEMRQRWLAPLCSGECRAGVAFGSLRRPGRPLLVASRDGEGWVLDGTAPWVTGWERIDVVHVAARTDDGKVVWSLVDAVSSPGLHAAALELAAVSASSTVTLTFSRLRVEPERVTLVEPFDEWQARDRAGLRPNGSLALGLARRCATLLDSSELTRSVDMARTLLDAAGPEELPDARAHASALALDAATKLVVASGGRAVTCGDHAQRLAREALFLLVFGQSPAIRDAQLALLRDRADRARPRARPAARLAVGHDAP
jgi:alkylation response protein AidB-like acyl-CoA dehydrogenase